MPTRSIIETPYDVAKLTVAVVAIFYIGAFVDQRLFFVSWAGWAFIVAALLALAVENVVYNSWPEDTERNGGWLWFNVVFHDPWRVRQPFLVCGFGLCAGLSSVLFYAALDTVQR